MMRPGPQHRVMKHSPGTRQALGAHTGDTGIRTPSSVACRFRHADSGMEIQACRFRHAGAYAVSSEGY